MGGIIKRRSRETLYNAGDFNQPKDGSKVYFANKKVVEDLILKLDKLSSESSTGSAIMDRYYPQDRHGVYAYLRNKKFYEPTAS